MIKFLSIFFTHKATIPNEAKPITPLSPKRFTWDEQTIDNYGKPTTLEELLKLQQEIAGYYRAEQEEAEENMSPSPAQQNPFNPH